MRALLSTVLLCLALLCSPAASATASAAEPVECTAVEVLGGICTTTGTTGGQTTTADQGGPDPVDPLRPYTQRRFIPACGVNTLANGGDVMCTGAATLCNTGGRTGLTAFFVYARTFDPAVSEGDQPPFVRQPGYVCIGATESGVPGAVLVAQRVQRDIERYVVLRASTRIDPRATTLVNVETIFSTPQNKPTTLDSFTLEAAGRSYSVSITIKPESYTWHFGDGHWLTTTRPGVPLTKDVTHIYEAPSPADKPFRARVDIEWSGTFTINGGEPIPVEGRVTTTGQPTDLLVTTARSELVRD